MSQEVWLLPRPSAFSFLCHCLMTQNIPIQWMTSSYMLGCLDKCVVLCFLLLIQICPLAPALFMWSWALNARALFLRWYHIQQYTKAASITAVGNFSTFTHYWESIWKDGMVHGMHGLSLTNERVLCGAKARVSGHRTDALQTYTLAYE